MTTSETLGSTTYKISGYDRKTGKSSVLVIEAESQAAALQQASSRGMAVAACEALKSLKPTPGKSTPATKAQAQQGSRSPVLIISLVAIVATGALAFVLGRQGAKQQPLMAAAPPTGVVAKSEVSQPPPQAPSQPKGFQIHGTPEEMKEFGFLTKYDEQELPQQFKGYMSLLSNEAQRLITAKTFDETVGGNAAHVDVLSIERTEVIRTTSLDSPYRGVATGRISVTTVLDPAQAGPGYNIDYGMMAFTAGFDVRTDEASKVRGWVLSDVKAYRSGGAGEGMDVSPQAQKILAASADAAVARIQTFLQGQMR